MDQLVSFLPFVAILGVFWLVLIRPAQKRQKETARMQASLQPGQRVMLTSGIFATVVSLTDDRARVQLTEGVEVEVLRAAVGRVEEPAAGADEATDADGGDNDSVDEETRPEA